MRDLTVKKLFGPSVNFLHGGLRVSVYEHYTELNACSDQGTNGRKMSSPSTGMLWKPPLVSQPETEATHDCLD